jgi:hypothetical protein
METHETHETHEEYLKRSMLKYARQSGSLMGVIECIDTVLSVCDEKTDWAVEEIRQLVDRAKAKYTED